MYAKIINVICVCRLLQLKRRFFLIIPVDSQDMDISPGDSTPTSEASYTHSSTPTTQNNEGPLLLANALPRLASHPSTSTPSQMHFSNSSCVGGII